MSVFHVRLGIFFYFASPPHRDRFTFFFSARSRRNAGCAAVRSSAHFGKASTSDSWYRSYTCRRENENKLNEMVIGLDWICFLSPSIVVVSRKSSSTSSAFRRKTLAFFSLFPFPRARVIQVFGVIVDGLAERGELNSEIQFDGRNMLCVVKCKKASMIRIRFRRFSYLVFPVFFTHAS